MSYTKLGLSFLEFRAACIRASIRRFLKGPFLVFRSAMLKLGLKKRKPEGLLIEAIPCYQMGVPQENKYHITC